MALRNAFADLSTEATAAEVRDMLNQRSSSGGDAHLISGNRVRFRRDFVDPTLAAFDVSTGTNQAVTAGNGNMTITTGTTANQQTTVTTKQTFMPPFKAAFGFKVSQKIANAEFYVEVVAVNDDGTLDESVVAAWRVAGSDSTTTNIARVEVRNGGATRSMSGNVTVSTHTSDCIFEIVVDSDEVYFATRSIDSTAARLGATVRNSIAPDPQRRYALRYRVATGATAPASNTTFTSQFLTAVDFTEIQTEITAGPGTTSASQALPVHIAGGAVSLTSTAIAASSSVTGTIAAKVLSAAGTNATLVKASAARVYGYQLANTSASWRFVKVYNSSSAPTVGGTAVLYTIPLPPGGVATAEHAVPLSHATGLSYAITAGAADNDAAAVGAGDVVGHIIYI